MNHYERESILNKDADGNTMAWMAEREKENLPCCEKCGVKLMEDEEKYCVFCLIEKEDE